MVRFKGYVYFQQPPIMRPSLAHHCLIPQRSYVIFTLQGNFANFIANSLGKESVRLTEILVNCISNLQQVFIKDAYLSDQVTEAGRLIFCTRLMKAQPTCFISELMCTDTQVQEQALQSFALPFSMIMADSLHSILYYHSHPKSFDLFCVLNQVGSGKHMLVLSSGC